MIRKLLAAAIALIAAMLFVLSCSPPPAESGAQQAKAAAPAAAPITPAMLEQGRGVYKTYCAACHGESGRGDGPGAGVMKPPPRDHTDRAYMSTLTDEDLAKVIQMGGAIKGKPLMPGNPQIKGADLAALVAYTRSLSTGGGAAGGH
jgi:mono/diheme cytochrome c family protein